MSVALVLVTHNRVEYTRKCLNALLGDATSEFDLYLWDNASTDGTQAYLRDEVRDPRIKEVILHKENPGPTQALNTVWGRTKADLVGKIDNDCLVTPGWVSTLAAAHKDIRELGAVACWHFRHEDFVVEAARSKIQVFGEHRVFRHPWVCGSGFLLKRSTFRTVGRCAEGDKSIGLTSYFVRMASAGFINGWYYPLILQDHMDDPFSSHCVFHDDASMRAVAGFTYTMRTHGITSYEGRLQRRAAVVNNLLYGPYHPRAYLGWRNKLRRRIPALDRLAYIWRRLAIKVRRGAPHTRQ